MYVWTGADSIVPSRADESGGHAAPLVVRRMHLFLATDRCRLLLHLRAVRDRAVAGSGNRDIELEGKRVGLPGG